MESVHDMLQNLLSQTAGNADADVMSTVSRHVVDILLSILIKYIEARRYF